MCKPKKNRKNDPRKNISELDIIRARGGAEQAFAFTFSARFSSLSSRESDVVRGLEEGDRRKKKTVVGDK